MQNRPVSPADWFRSAPSFIPPEELQALKDRAAARIQQERQDALRRAAELDADLRALSGEEGPGDVEQGDAGGRTGNGAPAAGPEPSPDSTWSVRAILSFFARHHPGARAADYMTFLRGFRPADADKTIQSNVYDALKVLKRDGVVRADGQRGDYRYYFQGGKKQRP